MAFIDVYLHFSFLPIMPKYSVGACTIYSGPPSALFYIRIVMLSVKITGKQFYRDWLEFYGSGLWAISGLNNISQCLV